MKPRIAIPEPNSDAEYSTRALPDYLNSLAAAGAEAVLLPLDLTPEEAAQRIKECDGILLPGSPADVDPQKYGAQRHPKTAAADPARDNLDELLLQDAHAMRKPLLGICYGTQSLNVWRGGTLVQHIESPVGHQRPDDKPRGFVIEHEAVVESERSDWAKTVAAWQALAKLKPLNPEYRLRQIDAQVAAGEARHLSCGCVGVMPLQPIGASAEEAHLAAGR